MHPLDRLSDLLLFLGSAAAAAFLAACITSPRVANYACDTDASTGLERCELVGTTDARPADDGHDASPRPRDDRDALAPLAVASLP
jgi:hypothetical protein